MDRIEMDHIEMDHIPPDEGRDASSLVFLQTGCDVTRAWSVRLPDAAGPHWHVSMSFFA